MTLYRYYQWDGAQQVFALDEHAIMGELSDQLLTHGDVGAALRNMMRRGVPGQFGHRAMGLQDLLAALERRRQEILDQHNLSSIVENINQRVRGILQREEGALRRQLRRAQAGAPGAPGQAPRELDAETTQRLLKDLERRASHGLDFLRTVPRQDPAQAIAALRDYEFADPQAKAEFDDLLQSLRRQTADAFFKDIAGSLQGMSGEDMQALRQMVGDLNELLERRLRGEDPGFRQFMERHGPLFGPGGPRTMEELIDRLTRQMAQVESLLNSLSPEQRQQLRDLLQSVFAGEGLQQELARLAANLEGTDSQDASQLDYLFQGGEDVDLSQALRLVDTLHQIEDLERQVRKTQEGAALDAIDASLAREVLGPEAQQALERMTALAAFLEQRGYIRKVGPRFELTPKGMRKIGQRALQQIFAHIKKDRAGSHEAGRLGSGVEYADDAKPYQFGDTFAPHLHKTLMNAVMRQAGTPVRVQAEDFQVYRTEHLSLSSTVLMVDLSLSMAMRGNFVAAKKVALALDNLIRSRFPRDKLYIVGFSTYAREVKPDRLPYLSWDEFDPYTNIQHGLAVAQKLLSRVKAGTKQIIMISDGEPTAHMENGQLFLQYPPSPRTIRVTLSEVKRCTQQGIVINTFMLDRSSYLVDFVDQLTRINRGRVFYTTPERLGHYLLVDYLDTRQRKVVV